MDATETKKEVPSKEQVIKFYQDQIEVTELRAKLVKLNADIAQDEFRRLQFTINLAQLSNPSSNENIQDHIVTQEDLDNNPELAENNVKVGDKIQIAVKPDTDEDLAKDESPVRQLKKD